MAARELSIFVDESGDFGRFQPHSPYYVLGLVLHDQGDDIAPHLERIHQALRDRQFDTRHAIHTGPLIRREQDYEHMRIEDRRSLFRVLFDFVRGCDVQLQSWTFHKRRIADGDELVAEMSRALGAMIRDNYSYFQQWDRVVIYYDNGQKEVTNLVNSAFNAHLSNVDVRRVLPADYSLFQAADLCCTMELLRTKLQAGGLSKSESDFFSTSKVSAERALKKTYLKPLEKKRFVV